MAEFNELLESKKIKMLKVGAGQRQEEKWGNASDSCIMCWEIAVILEVI